MYFTMMLLGYAIRRPSVIVSFFLGDRLVLLGCLKDVSVRSTVGEAIMVGKVRVLEGDEGTTSK